LLHVIEEKKFMKLGSSEYRSVDVRIITATNRDLKRLVMEKKFREDLYYRLNLAEIQVPPLRERKEDISPIVYGYLRKLNSKYSKTVTIASEALEKLTEYEWPGNIRELLNSLERIHLLKAAGEIKLQDLPHPIAVEDLSLCGSGAPFEP
ncbi:sigma 54-interacting transcriptional regulator, partial [Ammoniphilus sp. 3BR4]|uniref:sigma 54-interacting transcriptional regulator n=1 Tax=Ammoniphilus sp. 3BR4 TaxID=3158265 RepID=UPI0034673233